MILLVEAVTARLEYDEGKLAGWKRGRFGSCGDFSKLDCPSSLRRREDCGEDEEPLGDLPEAGGFRKVWRSDAMVGAM